MLFRRFTDKLVGAVEYTVSDILCDWFVTRSGDSRLHNRNIPRCMHNGIVERLATAIDDSL